MKKFSLANTILHIFLIFVSSVFLFPVIVMVRISFQNGGINNYIVPLSQPWVAPAFLNSAIITIPTVVLVIFIASLTGFALSKLNIKGKNVIFPIFLLGLMLPVAAIIVQLFLLIIKLGLINNHLSVILPVVSLTMPFGLLVLKNYMDDIPNDLVEAAVIDGCRPFRIYYQIIVPLTMPAIAAVVIFTFLNAWNEFLMPLVFLRKQAMLPVTKLPTMFMGEFARNYHMFFASFVGIILPVALMYAFLQKYFIKGLTAGAIKQ